MKPLGTILVVAGLLAGPFLSSSGAEPDTARDASAASPAANDSRDVLSLATKIDALIAKRWEAEHAVGAPPADDATFIRRASLDIAGKIPSVAELHEFLDDASPEKRQKLVERLLDSPGYVMH